MKKLIVCAGLTVGLLGATNVFAVDTTICPKTANSYLAGPGAVPPSGTAGTHYMMTAIAPKCSANTNVAGMDGTSGAWYAVGANSVKGMSSFSGNTNGGAVAKTADCAVPGGCTTTEAETARTAANTAAGST